MVRLLLKCSLLGMLTIVLFFTHTGHSAILAGPYLQMPGENGMTIKWISDDGGVSAVSYGPDLQKIAKGKNGEWFEPLQAYMHRVTINRLKSATSYRYQIHSNTTVSEVYDFQTAPRPGSPISFLAISDAQSKPDIPMTCAAIDRLVKFDLIVFSGDLVNKPHRITDWYGKPLSFFDVFCGKSDGAPLLQKSPLFPSLGNHEYYEKDRSGSHQNEAENLENYTSIFDLPGNERYYSHDYGNTHFVHLNACRLWRMKPKKEPRWPLGDAITPASPQYKWLAKDLTQNRDKWLVVSLHHPIFGMGRNAAPPFCVPERGEGGEYRYPRDVLYQDLRPLLEAKGVDLVIWGHNHLYEHYQLNGIHYIESSNIGNTYGVRDKEAHGLKPIMQNSGDRSFTMVRVDRDRMKVTAYKATDGMVLESFVINRK